MNVPKTKHLITATLLFFALTPLVFMYSQKMFYWIECSGKTDAPGASWGRCGGLGIQYIYYALATTVILLLAGGLLMLYATRSQKAK
jgi:hypothetical protein